MVEPSPPSCPTLHDDTNHVSERKEEDLPQDERATLDGTVWRKLDKRVLPLCISFFVLAMVDVINIGNARVAGLQKSLAMSNYQYSMVLTISHIPLLVSEFPSTLLLKHVGPDLMLPGMIALWGLVSAAQGFVNNYLGLMVCRFFLGLVGGGVFPSIFFYFSFFYPRKQLQLRVAAVYASGSISGIISGLLAAAIEQLDGRGGKSGWAWMFILEGTFTFVFGVISLFLVPRSPETARFLTEKERAYVVSTLKCAGSVSEDNDNDNFRWTEVVKAIKSPHVWLLAVVSFFGGTIMTGLSRFEPTIIAGLGYAGSRAQLMSTLPFATAFVLCFISAIISDRRQCRGYTLIFFSMFQVIGFSMFYANTSRHIRYASLFFSVTGAFCAVPTVVTWLTNNSAPHTRRATAMAVNFIMFEMGGTLSTWLIGTLSSAPNYTSAMITFIAMSTTTVVLSTVNLVYLRRQNYLKGEKRRRMGKEGEPEGLGDRSAWFLYSL